MTVADAGPATDPREQYAFALGLQAFVYAYPVYEMARLRASVAPRRNAAGEFAGASPESGLRWLNHVHHSHALIGAGGSRVVSPNNDTVYSTAWIDLSRGPVVLAVPDTADRYYVAGLLDFYTNPFGHIGRRTTGTRAGEFLLTPPAWRGEVPPSMREVPCPTPFVWMIARVMVDSPDDLPAANAIQDGIRLRPLVGAPAGWTGDAVDCWFDRGARFDASHFSAVVNRAMRENPPPCGDAALLEQFARVGIGPQFAEQAAALGTLWRSGFERAFETGRRMLDGERQNRGSAPRGWQPTMLIGESFGADHLLRATVARSFIGALASAEALYPIATTDTDGEILTGASRYRIRFAPGGQPPVDAYWSLTIYDFDTKMLVPNAIERYRIGDRSAGLVTDPDGGLTIDIQAAPNDTARQANWLPAPAGRFYLILRAYQPRAELLDGRYVLPGIERVAAN
ncbi:MAG: DUF1254 domain-containing protein [Burkholderiaceae bacterium]|nr:DUF1254 domain-containing protein [Burkholderiaceae bacterium]